MSLDGQRITILVVDDEPEIRRLLVAMLAHDYRVFGAGRAEEALSIARDLPALDLLITDVVMPGMDGVELANRMVNADPELPVLFISGCLPDKTVLSRFSGKHRAFIPKPFNYQVLGHKIRELAEATAAPREA